MRGFEPRSRHHDNGACSPLHHTGKEQLLSYPRDSALLRFVRPEPTQRGICNRSAARNRHLYFTTRGLVDTFCCAFFVELHVLVSLRWTTAVSPVGRSWFSECSTDEVPIVLEHNAHFCVGTAATPFSVSITSSTRVRWDQGTSASPNKCRRTHYNILSNGRAELPLPCGRCHVYIHI